MKIFHIFCGVLYLLILINSTFANNSEEQPKLNKLTIPKQNFFDQFYISIGIKKIRTYTHRNFFFSNNQKIEFRSLRDSLTAITFFHNFSKSDLNLQNVNIFYTPHRQSREEPVIIIQEMPTTHFTLTLPLSKNSEICVLNFPLREKAPKTHCMGGSEFITSCRTTKTAKICDFNSSSSFAIFEVQEKIQPEVTKIKEESNPTKSSQSNLLKKLLLIIAGLIMFLTIIKLKHKKVKSKSI